MKKRNLSIKNIILPSAYSRKVQEYIDKDELGKPENRLLFIRESVSYFESRLPRPSPEEYAAISMKFCDKYPALRDGNRTNYWVYCS